MPRGTLPTRLLVRLLARSRGEVRALQDVQHLRGVARFTLLFGLTVIIPAVALAYLALGSLRAEETRVDQEIRDRAEQTANQLQRELETTFLGFEHRTGERLLKGQSPLTNLAELSPYLRAAFRYDRDGNLAAPFVLPEQVPRPEAAPAYRRLYDRALRLEIRGDKLQAVAIFDQASRLSGDQVHEAEAEFAHARALMASGRHVDARRAFEDLYTDHANVRDRYGFRMGDLAVLKRAEISFQADPDVGATALQQIVDDILSDRWTIGYPGEAAIARRALRVLQGRVDPDWLGRARTRLENRTTQLYWAEQLRDELEVFEGPMRPQPEGIFEYPPRAATGSLWATLWWRGQLYVFYFQQREILSALRVTTAAADELDEDLELSITETGESSENPVLTRTQLTPLPQYLEVALADPQRLAAKKSKQRLVRLAVLLLLVATTTVGVILTAMLVGRELEGARMKADFAANVSHELRSPITQIRLKAEALVLDLVFDEQDRRSHYEAIVGETERLSRLVDNVLDFAAIERGVKKYTFRPQDLGEVVRNAAESHRSTLEARGLDVEVDVPYDLPVVWIDREAVSQVVTNLMSNAAKYAGEGNWVGVKARVGLDGVDVTVADRGIGITPEDLDKVFDHFYRSGDPQVRRRKGTGIGLSIVRYIVEAHGGAVSVESTPGRGTAFTVTFPLEPPRRAGD